MQNRAQDNVALAKKAYGALEDRGAEQRQDSDFQPFLDALADDVVFRYAAPEGTPLSRELHGKPEVIEFLTVTAPELVEDVHLTRPLEFVGDGDRVVVLGAESYTLKKTGAQARNKSFAVVMDFRDGRVVRLVQIKDLSEFVEAYGPAAAPA